MIEWWQVGTVLGTVMACAYIGLGGGIFQHLVSTRQWSVNPLAVVTFVVFTTVGVMHAVHVMLIVPWDGTSSEGARLVLGDGPYLVWSSLAAGMALFYFYRRARLRQLYAHPLSEDLARRRREALAIQRDVLARLEAARSCLDELPGRAEGGGPGEPKPSEACIQELELALEDARDLIGEIMPPHERRAGGLRTVRRG